MARSELVTYTCDACGREIGTGAPASLSLRLVGEFEATRQYNFDLCDDCLAAIADAVNLPIE